MILVSDLDNTLIDSTERARLCSIRSKRIALECLQNHDYETCKKAEHKEFASCYYSPLYLEFDKPINETIQKLNELYDQGAYIYILTARPMTMFTPTKYELAKFNIKYHKLILKSKNDDILTSHYKYDKLKQLIRKYGTVYYFDRNENMRKTIKKFLPCVIVLDEELFKKVSVLRQG